MRRRSKRSRRVPIPRAAPVLGSISSSAALVLGERRAEKRARFEVSLHDGRCQISLPPSPELGSPRHGRFFLVLPSTRLPVTTPIDFATDKEVATLNDLDRCALAIDGKTWNLMALVVDELALDDTVLTLRLRGALALDLLDDDEALKRLDAGGEDALGPARFEPFALAVKQRVRVRGGPRRRCLPPSADAPPRQETLDLSSGLGLLRWTDDLAMAERLYPDGIVKPGAKSGSVVIATGFEVGGFLETTSGALLDATVLFDPEDRTLTGLVLRSGDFAGASEAEVAPALVAWCRDRLALGPGTERTESDGLVDEVWRRGPMRVVLRRRIDDSFAMLNVRRER